jgi:hypothetical protein
MSFLLSLFTVAENTLLIFPLQRQATKRQAVKKLSQKEKLFGYLFGEKFNTANSQSLFLSFFTD